MLPPASVSDRAPTPVSGKPPCSRGAQVRENLGESVPIVGSAHEEEIIPLLRKALGLPVA